MTPEQMKYDPAKHHRRSIRLKGHDYAGGGVYFVTLCAHREFVAWAGGAPFGAVNGAARMPPERPPERPAIRDVMEAEMQKTASLLPWMKWGEWVIMPDHFHAIVEIEGGDHGGLADVMTGFKAGVTRTLRRRGDILVAPNGRRAPETMRIWQRDYYERIVRSAEAEEKVAGYIRMNPWKCVQNFGNGLRGIGNPALWQGEKLGVLCSRNAPHIGSIPKADVYFGGWHSPKEQEMFDWLLEKKQRMIACPAWGIAGAVNAAAKMPPQLPPQLPPEQPPERQPVLTALEENRLLVLEMRNRDGDLAAAEARNRFLIEHADTLFVPHVSPGGMLERLLKEARK
jgi:hypothetical protein